MAKRRFRFFRWFFLALIVVGVALVFRQGLIPPRYTLLPAVDLTNGSQWFVDWRLAELKHDRNFCRAVLIGPNVKARPIKDKPLRNGCGWVNAVALSSAGGAAISVAMLSCEVTAAFALWMGQDVQPLAKEMFGSPVASISHLGSYSCRNIIGRAFWKKRRSEHATANALDIGGFRLQDGRSISVNRDWRGNGKKAQFLRAIHARACRYFRVAIGPEFNEAHNDHFHYDRGILSRCR